MFGLFKRPKTVRQGPPPGTLPLLDDLVSEFRPVTRRQRLAIVAVALVTVVTLWLLLLFRPGGHPRVFPPAPPASSSLPCPPGQASGCVGGQADVLLLPAAPASAAR
ncbi:hypothetical protein [Aquabacterium sp.]|uniref:hypothetical protein n=1 Tax=Aquabacterium sp. TaxID=1872578 RepID=UPI003784574A